jgi:hypothetical protein
LQNNKAYFILFITIHDVLKAEKLLKKQGLAAEVVPVPRNISSDCGVCIKSSSPVEALFSLLGGISGVKCYVFDGKEYRPGKAR